MAQVREHTESTRSQYRPGRQGGRAGLGTQRHRGDRHRPGHLRQVGSGPGRVHRAGHPGLLRRCRGHLRDRDHPPGPVQYADVARLAEFARITGTLLIDPDGVYDPADVNDRVLLGFKGTMGEMELHVMAQRLHANKRGRGRARRAAHPAAGRVRPRRRRRYRDRPRRPRSRPRSGTCSPRSTRVRIGLRGRPPRSPAAGSPLRAYGGAWAGQLALGQAHPRPACWAC